MENVENNLFRNLKNILSNTESYFDEGLVQYLFDNIPAEMLKNQKIGSNVLKGYNLETNIWGKIIILKEVCDYESDYLIWENAIKKTKKPQEIMVKPVFTINDNKVLHDIDLNTLLVLKEIKNWKKLENNNIFLSKEQELLVVKDLMREEQSYYIWSDDDENCDFLLSKIKKYLPEIRKERSIVTGVLGSTSILRILKDADPNLLSDIFTEEDLLSLYKKSHNKEIYPVAPNLISKLMPLYDSKIWLKILNKDKVDIFEMFALIIKKASGHTFDMNYSEIKELATSKYVTKRDKPQKSSNAAKEMAKRIIFFKDVLKEISLTEHDKIKWYSSILNTNNKDLYNESRKIIELPERKKEPFSDVFYLKYEKVIEKYEIEVNYNHLNETILHTDKVDRKKVKI